MGHDKTSIAVEDNILTHGVIQRMVYANVSIMGYYLPSIQAVMEGGVLPGEALVDLREARIAQLNHHSPSSSSNQMETMTSA